MLSIFQSNVAYMYYVHHIYYNTDYIVLEGACGELQVAPYNTSACLTVAIVNDDTIEESEDFIFTIMSATVAVLRQPTSVTVTILDDDSVTSPTGKTHIYIHTYIHK